MATINRHSRPLSIELGAKLRPIVQHEIDRYLNVTSFSRHRELNPVIINKLLKGETLTIDTLIKIASSIGVEITFNLVHRGLSEGNHA